MHSLLITVHTKRIYYNKKLIVSLSLTFILYECRPAGASLIASMADRLG